MISRLRRGRRSLEGEGGLHSSVRGGSSLSRTEQGLRANTGSWKEREPKCDSIDQTQGRICRVQISITGDNEVEYCFGVDKTGDPPGEQCGARRSMGEESSLEREEAPVRSSSSCSRRVGKAMVQHWGQTSATWRVLSGHASESELPQPVSAPPPPLLRHASGFGLPPDLRAPRSLTHHGAESRARVPEEDLSRRRSVSHHTPRGAEQATYAFSPADLPQEASQHARSVSRSSEQSSGSLMASMQVADPAVLGYFQMAEVILSNEDIEEEGEEEGYGGEQDAVAGTLTQRGLQGQGLVAGAQGHPRPLYITPMQALAAQGEGLISPGSTFLPQDSMSTSEWSLHTKSLPRTLSAAQGTLPPGSRESIRLADFDGQQALDLYRALDPAAGFVPGPAGLHRGSSGGGATAASLLAEASPHLLELGAAASMFSPSTGTASPHPFLGPMLRSNTSPDGALTSAGRRETQEPSVAYSSSNLSVADPGIEEYFLHKETVALSADMPVTDPEVESYFLQKEMALSSDVPLVLRAQREGSGVPEVVQVADPEVMHYFLRQESNALSLEEASVSASMRPCNVIV